MTASHLSAGKVNFNIIRESYRKELIDCLDNACTGSKALVWDEVLMGTISLIAEYQLLKEHEVEKMFTLHSGRLPSCDVKNVVFIVRPKYSLMEMIAQNVRHEELDAGPFRKEFHIFFVPRKSVVCERKLEELGVRGTFTTIDEYSMDLIPLDSDIVSMEVDDSFRQCYLENDFGSLFHAARCLITLQTLYGVIPNINAKGDMAKKVMDIMLRMRREMAGQEAHVMPQIDSLFLIDRKVDPLTPLLSQLTYEGLIDEIFGIKNTASCVPPETLMGVLGEGSAEVQKKLILNSSSELFADLRDRNFNSVGPTLAKKVKLFTAQMDERHTAKISELKQFVSKLPHMLTAKTNYSIHTALAQLVRDVTETDEFMDSLSVQQEFINEIGTDKSHLYIEDCIAKREPFIKVLRLICIQCYCNNGLKPKILEFYKREIVQTYGYENIVTLHNLEKVGLLRVQELTKPYSTIRKTFKLIDEHVNETGTRLTSTSVMPATGKTPMQSPVYCAQNPTDISYTYSGYAPLSIRLAQYLNRPGWRSITDALALLPGPSVEEVQQIPAWLRNRTRHASGGSTHSTSSDQKVTLVFFLGGVTYAEISALRFLSQQEDLSNEYIIATTKIINGNTWLESLTNTYAPKPANPF